MQTSADMREGSRTALAAARALGSTDLSRSRKLAAHGLALAFKGEQMERDSSNRNTIVLQRLVMARRSSRTTSDRRRTFELDALI